MNIKALSLVLLASIIATGCAVMSEDECRVANWNTLGYNDGVDGRSSSRFTEYVEACSKYVFVDQKAYNEGRRQGAEQFCTNDNGFNQGRNNKSVTDICNVSSNKADFNKYYHRGNVVYKAHSYLSLLDKNESTYVSYMGEPMLYRLTGKLQANVDYLNNLRPQIQKYVDYVDQYGYDNDLQEQNWESTIYAVPYKDAANMASAGINLIDRRNNALHEIRHRMERANDCMVDASRPKISDGRRYDRCRREYECLMNEEHKLNYDVDNILSTFRYDSEASNYNTDRYTRCR